MELDDLRTDAPRRLFDRYLMVDWSSSNKPTRETPTKDAIWIGELTAAGRPQTFYCRTRAAAVDVITKRLAEAADAGQRVLVGFDFAFGYPTGFAVAAGLVDEGSPPWLATWQYLAGSITDSPDNVSNRFEVASDLNSRVSPGPGPFWGCPKGSDTEYLTPSHVGVFSYPYPTAGAALERLRVTERHMKGVQPTWKLFTTGSVGSQVLVGIPRVHALRRALGSASAVWPFETGFTDDPLARAAKASVLLVEIWPGIVDAEKLAALTKRGHIRDEAQVHLMCTWCAEHDERGSLGRYFDRPVLKPEDLARAESEEGWILGCIAQP